MSTLPCSEPPFTPPLLRLVEQHEKELRLLTADRLHPRSVKCKRVRQKQFPGILASAKAQQFGLVNNLHAELLGFVQLRAGLGAGDDIVGLPADAAAARDCGLPARGRAGILAA